MRYFGIITKKPKLLGGIILKKKRRAFYVIKGVIILMPKAQIVAIKSNESNLDCAKSNHNARNRCDKNGSKKITPIEVRVSERSSPHITASKKIFNDNTIVLCGNISDKILFDDEPSVSDFFTEGKPKKNVIAKLHI